MKRLLLIVGVVIISCTSALPKEVSHEDIREAILSLVHMFRDNGDKLERHEYRERQLGEQLKKALAGLDKRYRNQDQNIEKINGVLERLETRLRNIEGFVAQKQDAEKTTVDGIQQSIEKWLKDIDSQNKGSTASYTVQGTDKEKLEALELALGSRIDRLTATVEGMEAKLLMSGTTAVGPSNGKWKDVLEAIQHNEKSLRDLHQMTARTAREVSSIPNREEMEQMNNITQEVLQEVKEEIIAINERGVTSIETRLIESEGVYQKGHDEMLKSLTESSSNAETLYNDVMTSYEQLLKEIKGLSKVEQVMIQTADNVLDTKRRIEYGVKQILLEVGELIKIQGKDLNGTVNKRFNDIEATILDNQTGALTNLSTKIETEISQVWRQIGIMYQQLTASATALDRLQQQTETYVNGSVQTMDSMEGKVSMITSRMSEVDENLNFLLGKLSLVTSEFNQIKSGLAKALDNIKNSFLEVSNQIKDVGPGPNPIVGNEENELSP